MSKVSLPYPPSTNRIWRTGNGRQYMPTAVKNWKQSAALLAKAAGFRATENEVRVQVTLHPRITRTGKASKSRIDLDNAIKAALDALNGIAWIDDKQVTRIVAEVGLPVKNGGLTVCTAE